jgi:hypothetical protein
MNEKQRLNLKSTVDIIDTAETLIVDTRRINEGLVVEINCIINDIMRPTLDASEPEVIPPPSRRQKSRKLFRRKAGERPKKRSEMHASMEEIELQISAAPPSKKKWLKKLYRAIMRKAHPDVVGKDLPEKVREEYTLLARKAAEAYSKDNEFDMLRIGISLDLYADVDYDDQCKMLITHYSNIQEDIVKIQTSDSWAWGFKYPTLAGKLLFIKKYCEINKISPPPDDELKTIIKKYSFS